MSDLSTAFKLSLSHTSSPDKEKLNEDLLTGITKNYFGSFQSRTCMHDSGCNGHLLAISSTNELESLLCDHYSFTDKSLSFAFRISRRGWGSYCLGSKEL